MLDQTILKNPLLMKSANLIDGEWIAAGADAIPVTNPATSVLLGSVPNSGRKETKRAVEAASRAFPAWRAKTAAERAAILRRLHALVLEHQDDLARLLTLEQGKPLAEAKGEVGMTPPMCSLVRRGGAAHLWRRHPVALGRPAHPRHQGAGRRRRRHHAVELPVLDDRPQARAGARRRLHDRDQAGVADALFGPCLGRAVRARPASRRASSTSSPARPARSATS